MGWMALFCALPMWATSVNWVRRRYYSLFKLAHWLFIGVFVFGVMHVGVRVFSVLLLLFSQLSRVSFTVGFDFHMLCCVVGENWTIRWHISR